MQTLHALCLPTPPATGAVGGLTARLITRPIAAGIDAWRCRQLRRTTAATLHSLDDRTLRDLGFHRSEIGSVAAEIGGLAEVTTIRAQMAHHLRA